MKILSRNLSTKEKLLVVVFILFLLGLAYYRFFYIPTKESIEAANKRRDDYQTQLVQVQQKEAQIRKMKEEIEELGDLSKVSRMESYNNSKAELTLLNRVLEPASDYSITFTNVTRNDDQIRRSFSLTFTTDSFVAAKRIISSLEASDLRCLLGDIQYSFTLRRADHDEETRGGRWIDDEYFFNVVTVNTSATFYETMYDGVPDAGLPVEVKK